MYQNNHIIKNIIDYILIKLRKIRNEMNKLIFRYIWYWCKLKAQHYVDYDKEQKDFLANPWYEPERMKSSIQHIQFAPLLLSCAEPKNMRTPTQTRQTNQPIEKTIDLIKGQKKKPKKKSLPEHFVDMDKFMNSRYEFMKINYNIARKNKILPIPMEHAQNDIGLQETSYEREVYIDRELKRYFNSLRDQLGDEDESASIGETINVLNALGCKISVKWYIDAANKKDLSDPKREKVMKKISNMCKTI